MASSEAPLQLYSIATPNGQKAGIMLEELGVPYEAHTINIMKGDQFKPDFLAISPNNKIPALHDKTAGVSVFESGAILMYLGEKYGRFFPTATEKRYEVLQWVFWQVGGLGPMAGQYNHFVKYAPEKVPYAIDRYSKETERLLGVLEKALGGKEYVAAGEYTIADMMSFPWVRMLKGPMGITADKYPGITAWLERIEARPAVVRGLAVTPFPTA